MFLLTDKNRDNSFNSQVFVLKTGNYALKNRNDSLSKDAALKAGVFYKNSKEHHFSGSILVFL